MSDPVASPAKRPTAASREQARRSASRSPSGSLYRVFWRWHFFAGVLVTPVLLIVTITGALSIFRAEIEDYAHAHLRFVEPGSARLPASEQVEAARSSRPELQPESLEQSADPNRASIVRLGDGTRSSRVAVYVDPYRGDVLGAVESGEPDPLSVFFDATLTLHRQLFLGTAGRLLVELTVGWTVILLMTGAYLWWPDTIARTIGVWRPRLRGKPYIILRDLHTVTGIYALTPMFLIVVTGLFYTIVWGEAFHLATRSLGGTPPAASTPDRGSPEKDPGAEASLPLDRIEQLARKTYPDRNLTIDLDREPGEGVQVRASNDYNNSYGPYVSAELELDPVDGSIRSHSTLAENERYWWHGWTYPLHVGSILGPTTKVLWLISCLVLIGLPITGVWMWWVRRPPGRTGFPKRPARVLPPWLIGLVALFGILLPIVGASMLLILLGEWTLGLARRLLRVGRASSA
ncbi:PepSY-associated TM helix domain-containing protein [Tautonia sociabilis]|uniref:PepSY domain-containing protein n=1 Tax=Tautonia sociabilis TaxID=2080755 RepID=A0A432MDV3_9BACT|nr:PepSY domain-containing protein [Tautonia sociabilis]RUL83182.1 PepSY domain-containing protein [Tautonia sociabilis]